MAAIDFAVARQSSAVADSLGSVVRGSWDLNTEDDLLQRRRDQSRAAIASSA